jgi:hypothetical protein
MREASVLRVRTMKEAVREMIKKANAICEFIKQTRMRKADAMRARRNTAALRARMMSECEM